MQTLVPEPESAEACGAVYFERVCELGPELAVATGEIERRRKLPAAIVDAFAEQVVPGAEQVLPGLGPESAMFTF
ncbi:MAG TPA: hypothetical protein VL985_17145 [Stellaceae bacterium]|nr:hypothetical protein [Stellaceae bacterium]